MEASRSLGRQNADRHPTKLGPTEACSAEVGSGSSQAADGRYGATGDVVSTTGVPAAPAGGVLADGFLAANGQLDSRAATKADGRPNRSRRAGQDYDRLTWADVADLVATPAATSKALARCAILSTYRGPDGRTHEVQRQRGAFVGLAVDVDTGNPSLDDVVAAVAAVTGGAHAYVYSSSSATADKRKWRVLVPLASPLAGADYRDTQLALFRLLEARGILCDAALARTGQVAFMPNVPPDRRDADGRPLFYQSHVAAGPLLELVAGHAIVTERDAIRAAEAAELAARVQRQAERAAERLAVEDAGGDTFEPIAHFNDTHTVVSMLARYGFEQHPRRLQDWRSPLSESGSYSTQDRGDHWVSVSSWAANHGVGRPTRSGHHAGDAWALYVHFEHGGNHAAAVRAYAELVRPRATVRTKSYEPSNRDTKAENARSTVGQVAARVEHIPTPPTATLDAIRNDVADQLARVLEERPALAVLRHGTGGSKTTTAVPMVAAIPGRVTWSVGSHAAAAAVVAMHQAAGHTDVAAMPPRDETTCRCWTRTDVERVAAAHGVRPGPSMEQALAVGSPMAACVRCPLWPSFKRPANATAPDPALAAFAPVDDATMAEAFVDPWADNATTMEAAVNDDVCEYFRRVDAASHARVVVQCQARTERRPGDVAGQGWERSTLVTDENAMAVLRPRRLVLVEELRAVASVLTAAAANRTHRRRQHRSHAAWRRADVLPTWLRAMAGVAMDLVAMAEQHAAGQTRAVRGVTHPGVDVEQPSHTTVMAAVAGESLPRSFKADALDLVWLVATRGDHNANVYVEQDASGVWHGSFHRAWHLELPPGVQHIVLDATADVAALLRVRPDAVLCEPPGSAALVHDARQWWREVNNRTHPLVVLELLERVLDAMGAHCAALFIPKRHRKVLFPQTRPRRGTPMDLPADVDAIANWNAGRRELAGDPARRMTVARECAARVERLRARMARDANGNVLVDHHRGSRARGSNDFMAGACDALIIIGHVRVPTVEVASYLLATGQGDAAAVDGGWGDVEGQLQHVDGGARTVRWRGYADARWAEAARALNRAELQQTVARARANLPGAAGGVPVVVVAGEPTGLPLADMPVVVPAGVAAAVEAVRRLVAGGAGGPTLAPTGVEAAGGRGKVGKVGTAPEAVDGGGESGQPCTGHTPSLSLYTVGRILPGVALPAVVAAVGAPERSTRRWLADAVAMGLLARHGSARATRYALPGPPAELAGPRPVAPPLAATTGVAEAAPAGPVLERRVGGGARATAPPTPVPPAPHPRDANAPESVTGVEVEVGKMSKILDIFTTPTAADTGIQDGNITLNSGTIVPVSTPPRAPTPAAGSSFREEPTAASTAGIVGPTSNPPTRPRFRLPDDAPKLTGAAKAAMVAELRGHLRAVAFNARIDAMNGGQRDDLAVDELLALFADAPTPMGRGP